MCKLKKAPGMHKCPKTSVHDFTASDVPKLSYGRFSQGTAETIDGHPAYTGRTRIKTFRFRVK